MSKDYSKIKKLISSERLKKYEIVCNNCKKKTLKLYQTNLRLSQAFYPILSLYEIVLRNAINEELALFFSDQNWLFNQRNGFMSDPSLTYTDSNGKTQNNIYLKSSVNEVIRKNKPFVTHHKIISELKLGYWTSLFDNNHFRVLKGVPRNSFKKLPSKVNRKKLYKKLCDIRDFRNRIYHNEPIIFEKDSKTNKVLFSLQNSNKAYNDIIEVFEWLDIDFNQWTKRINNIPFELQRAKYVFNYYPGKIYYFQRIILGCKHYKNKYLKMNIDYSKTNF
jgi:hypothetical protein